MRRRLTLTCFTVLVAALARCSGPGSSGISDGPVTVGTEPGVDAGVEQLSVTIDGQSVPVLQSRAPREAATSVSDSVRQGAVNANNAFAVDLYSQLRSASSTSNLLSSPISASLALTMTYAGARGTTATQMATALHYGSAASTIFDGQNAIGQALATRGPAAFEQAKQTATDEGSTAPSSDDYQLQVVNSIWAQSTYTWNAPFLDTIAVNYGAGLYLEDFVHGFDTARGLINDWVSQATADKINDLLPPGSLNSGTRMVLVNAVHLKLPWASPFDVSATASAPFATAAKTTVSVPFMHQTTGLPYVDDGQAQIVALPLLGNNVAIIIALPHGDLAAYEAGLSASSAGLAMPKESADVDLSLPSLSFTSPTFSLRTALSAMGMPDAFDLNTVDFTGLCTTPADGLRLVIADVLQKAMIGMVEGGVEAAAATAVIMEGGATGGDAGGSPEPIPMVVNRPYLVSIVDVPTGTLLFLGHVVDPTQAGGS